MPRAVKQHMVEASRALDWSAGDWLLAIAAEHGPGLRAALHDASVKKRTSVPDATFTALYLTPEEREEIDDQAVACGLNRSAFVTAVAQLGLGTPIDEVVRALTYDHGKDGTQEPPEGTGPAVTPGTSA